MILLGIDYGRKRIGLALAVNNIVEPRKSIVWREKKKEELFLKIKEICSQEKVEKIVVGLSHGKMGQETRRFVDELKKIVGLPVELVDETLTSWQAEKMVGWRHKNKIDAVAAALILERYLDKLAFN